MGFWIRRILHWRRRSQAILKPLPHPLWSLHDQEVAIRRAERDWLKR